MPSQNLMVLQSAVNRIAVAANGFVPRITVDGGMGAATASATMQALVWVAQKNCLGNRCVPDGIATSADVLVSTIIDSSGDIDQTAIMQRNTEISRCLNSAADIIGVGPGSGVPSSGGSSSSQASSAASAAVQNALDRFKSGSFLTSISTKFKALQPWQKVAVGGFAALGAIFVWKKIQKGRRA